MVIFIEVVQYVKNLGGKSRKNLVEHQIIKNDEMDTLTKKESQTHTIL